jgi:hypothetical protein
MSRDDRWAHLVNTAFRLDEARSLERGERIRSAIALIDSAIEVFPSSIEPIEDLEGYAVRRLLLGVSELLRSAGPAQD